MHTQAIILCNGQQHLVEAGRSILLHRLHNSAGEHFETDAVLYVQDNQTPIVGNPYVTGAKVIGSVVSHVRGEKVMVFKQKRRKNYRRKKGHRQALTEIRIERIELP